MRPKILAIVVLLISICIIGSVFFLCREETKETEGLKLSDFPEAFKIDTVIVIGKNASQIEKESAEAIAANLENLTGNRAEVINAKKIGSFKHTHNLIILGTPNSNEVLEELHNMADATRVTDEYPGEGKGLLQILENPWNEDKALLLVAGSDEQGVKSESIKLIGSEIYPHEERIIADPLEESGKEEIRKIVIPSSLEPIEVMGKIYDYRIPPWVGDIGRGADWKFHFGTTDPGEGFLEGKGVTYIGDLYLKKDGTPIAQNPKEFVLEILVLKYESPKFAEKDYNEISERLGLKKVSYKGLKLESKFASPSEILESFPSIPEHCLLHSGSFIIYLYGVEDAVNDTMDRIIDRFAENQPKSL